MSTRWLLPSIAFALACGCGGDDDGGSAVDGAPSDASSQSDDAALSDGAAPDAFYCPANPAGELGGACDADTTDSCGTDGTCLEGAIEAVVFAPEGYCVRTDFTDTYCAADGDCGAGGVCAEVAFPGAAARVCLPACCDFMTCPAHQACFETFNGAVMDKAACVPGSAAAVDGQACDGIYECNEASRCLDDFENPDGACETQGCTPGSNAGCHGGDLCIVDDEQPPYDEGICVVGCDGDTDCRMAEGYVCFDPDGGTPDDEYCRHPHVGDPCGDELDCGGAGWTCLPDPSFPGGTCTQAGCPTPGSTAGCTAGSICVDIGAENACIDRCPTPGAMSTCRVGYMCVDVDPGGGTTGGCLPP